MKPEGCRSMKEAYELYFENCVMQHSQVVSEISERRTSSKTMQKTSKHIARMLLHCIDPVNAPHLRSFFFLHLLMKTILTRSPEKKARWRWSEMVVSFTPLKLSGPKNFGSLNGQSDPSASISVGQFVVRCLDLQAKRYYFL